MTTLPPAVSGNAGENRHAAGHQHALGVLGESGSEDDVLDLLLGQVGLPFEQGDDDLRGEVIGSNSYKASALTPMGLRTASTITLVRDMKTS